MVVPFLLHKTASSFKETTNLCNWMRKLMYWTIYTVTVSWLTWTGRAPLYHFLGRSYGTGHRTCRTWSLQVLLHHSETKWISVFKKDIMYFIVLWATNTKTLCTRFQCLSLIDCLPSCLLVLLQHVWTINR